jgi:dethiobiotin synthetase
MRRIMVAGSGTGVGKTVVAAILTLHYQGQYWKPIECGTGLSSDTAIVKRWLKTTSSVAFPPSYSFKGIVSPHHAADLEGKWIDPHAIKPPVTSRTLIIEGVGGVLVPLTSKFLSIELFKQWECQWVIVSRHYLGSINHTLLTVNALKAHGVDILGIVFNGDPLGPTEKAILETTGLPLLGRILPEKNLKLATLQKYAKLWNHPGLKKT